MEDTAFQDAIAALKAGQRGRARILLAQVLRRDARNEEAWLWLSGAVESDADRLRCLQQVLAINPEHARAREGLALLRLKGVVPPEAGAGEPAPSAEGEPASVGTEPLPATQAVAGAGTGGSPAEPAPAEVGAAPPGEHPFVPPSIPEGFVMPPEPEPERRISVRALLVLVVVLVVVIVAIAILLSQRGVP